MSSRSILIAVLGLTLNGCAVYDYNDARYESRHYGGGHSVQRYEVYPVYPVYPQGYRYDYPRHDAYSKRYHSAPGYDGRHAGRHERHDRYERHDNDRRAGHLRPRTQPYSAGPAKQSWGDARPHNRDQLRRGWAAQPGADYPVSRQMGRSREHNQLPRQAPRQDRPRHPR